MIRRFILLFIPILLFSSQERTLKLIEESKLYNNNIWKALVHYSDDFHITDKKFLLSKKLSLKSEMIESVKSFYFPKEKFKNLNNHPQCKFPARFLFITHQLNINKNEFPPVSCSNFQTYKNKAPADNISLIYASEKVNNPSSMMGHTFLKFKGLNYKNKIVEHSISFYTILNSANLLTLAYQNIYSGMKGMFALQPYKNTIKQYTQKENRNVWEYELKLSEYKRKLIYYHIWELKSINMNYFFTKYNCSTVIYYILSLIDSKIYDDRKLWITPLNTVKFLYKYNLIQNSELIPSDEWLVKMTSENLKQNEINNIKKIINNKQYTKISTLDFNSLKLLESYSNLEYKHKNIDSNELKLLKKNIENSPLNNKNSFDISNYKSPYKIPDERQITIGYKNIDKEKFLKLSFLPASHLLNDNNREYFGESELKIAYLSVLINQKHIKLDEFTLYGMKSYIPYNNLTNDLSYQFELSIKKEYTKKMNHLNTFKIDGGIGLDFELWHDINLFALLNFGIGYNRDDNTHIFFNPQIGGMIYEIFNMKSLFYYQPLFINNNKIYDKFVLKHNIFLSKNYKFYFNLEKIDNQKQNYEFGFSLFF